MFSFKVRNSLLQLNPFLTHFTSGYQKCSLSSAIVSHCTKNKLRLNLTDCNIINYNVRKLSTLTLNSHFVCSRSCRDQKSNPSWTSINANTITVRSASNNTNWYMNYLGPEAAPSSFAQDVLVSMHDLSGLPWWLTIAFATIGLRMLITLPLGFFTTYNAAKLELLQPRLGELQERLRKEVGMAVREFNWDAKKAKSEFMKTWRRIMKEQYIEHNCHPLKSYVVLYFQLPVWILMSAALRNMSGSIPCANPSQYTMPGFRTEGGLWFSDLTAVDPHCVLPFLMGGLFLLNIEVNVPVMSQVKSRFHKAVIYGFRGFSLAMIPLACFMPSSVTWYWTCSALCGLTQNILTRLPAARRAVGIPQTPSEQERPVRAMVENVVSKFRRTA